MLMSNLFSPRIFFRMFVVFFIFEILLIVALVVAYYFELEKSKDSIKEVIIGNNDEVMNSFNSVMSNKINKFKLDLLLIGNHIKLLQNTISNSKERITFNTKSAFYNSFNGNNQNCLKKWSEIENYDLFNNIENYDITPVRSIMLKKNYFKGKKQKRDEEIIKDMMQTKELNYMTYYDSSHEIDENLTLFACYLKSIFKTIMIKNIIEERTHLYLNNLFLFYGDYVFQYPPNKMSLEALKSMPEYNIADTQCREKYTNHCMTEKFQQLIEFFNVTKNTVVYFHNVNEKLQVLSCLKIDKDAQNYICIQNELSMALNQINNQTFENSEITSLSIDIGNEINVLFALNKNISTFSELYQDDILGDLKLTKYPTLFHLLYYDIFKYQSGHVTESLIETLRAEYNETKTKILYNIQNLTSSSFSNVSIEIQMSFIDAQYNISGNLDRGNILYNR